MGRGTLAVAAVALASGHASAQQVGIAGDATYEDGILITQADITTCTYLLVSPMTVNVTEDYGDDGQAKVHGKFRKEALRRGGDAVILVTRGGSHMTAFAFSRREYHGRIIRYVDRRCAPMH